MATDSNLPPPDDVSPLDAIVVPLSRPAIERGTVPWNLLDVIAVATVHIGTSLLVGTFLALLFGVSPAAKSELPPDQWMMLILGSSIGSLAGMGVGIAWLRGAAQAVRPVKAIVIALVFCSLTVLAGEVTRALFKIPTSDTSPLQRLTVLSGGAIGAILGGGLAIRWLRGGTQATWADLGWQVHQWRANVLLGLVGFLVLMFPVFGLQALLNFLYERAFGPPPQHPLIQQLLDHPSGPGFLIAAFTAVIVAPLTEEFLFRAVLQGWLERVAIQIARYRDALASVPLAQEAERAEGISTSSPPGRPLLVWPIVVSSLVFALMHYSHGVAWIPLFFLALGLGYLYQRTRSLVAPIVLHVSLNASTMLILWLASK